LPWLFAKALMLAVKPVDPACFSEPPDRCAKPVLRPPVPLPPSGEFPGQTFNAPTPTSDTSRSTLSWPVFGPFLTSHSHPDFGQTRPPPAASTGRRNVSFGTLWEWPAGTPNTLAPNSSKLGQLRYARQGL